MVPTIIPKLHNHEPIHCIVWGVCMIIDSSGPQDKFFLMEISWWRIIYFLCPLHHYECLNENYSLVKEESSHLWQNLLRCSLLTDCSFFVCSQRSKQDKEIDLHEICCCYWYWWHCRCCRWFNKQAILRSVVPLSVLSSLSKVRYSCLFWNLVDQREVHGTQLGKELLLFSSASQNFFFWGLKFWIIKV